MPPRAASAAQLAEVITQAKAAGTTLVAPQSKVSQHPDPMSALKVALSEANPEDRILVFGSFFTVGGVLHDGLPKLNAPHLK